MYSKKGGESPQSWGWETQPYRPEIDISATSTYNQGTAPARPPAQESFWTTTATGTTALYWEPIWDEAEGMNVVVVMNADGSSGVNADIQLGFKVPILGWLAYLLVPLGALMLALGVLLIKRRKKP